jgi:hypothetical protein
MDTQDTERGQIKQKSQHKNLKKMRNNNNKVFETNQPHNILQWQTFRAHAYPIATFLHARLIGFFKLVPVINISEILLTLNNNQ